jgi:hypothetical protein
MYIIYDILDLVSDRMRKLCCPIARRDDMPIFHSSPKVLFGDGMPIFHSSPKVLFASVRIHRDLMLLSNHACSWV